jgi:hypothetical protein
MDCVFFIPPKPFHSAGGRRHHLDSDLYLDNVWYGSVALLFKLTVRIDINELRDVECAMRVKSTSITQKVGDITPEY